MPRQAFSSLRSDSNVVPRGSAWSLTSKLAIFLWVLLGSDVEAQNITAEMEALLAFKSSNKFFFMSSSRPSTGFWDTWRKTDKSPCNWVGISCTSNGSVRSIDLSGRNDFILIGIDPSQLRPLENLQQLILAGNQLSGDIPSGIYSLTNLRHLDLSDNGFTSTLPTGLNQLENLRLLYLDGNSFTGGIPLLDNLTQLQVLSLSRNRLDGPIPVHLNKLSSLTRLDLSNNKFNGTIPVLTSLVNLYELNVENNHLTGFTDPRFPGPRSLKHLLTSDNLLEGTLPIGLTEMLELRVVDMSSNLLSGSIPKGVARRGIDDTFWLDLSQNVLEGRIPEELFVLPACASLCSGHLNLSYNKLSGSIPEVPLQNNDRFYFTIDLSHNQLTGSFPTQLFSGISTLRLGANQFSGDIIDVLLRFGQNFQPSDIRFLDVGLAHNHFTGDLTRMIGNWKLLLSFISYIDLSNNLLTMSKTEHYTDPMHSTLEEVFSTEWMKEFRIAGNNFEGVSLPEEISLGELEESNGLEVLDVSNNHLVGSISEGVYTTSNLPAIKLLNLSGNNLIGPVPSSITRLPTLITLDVSRNNLSGILPDIPPNSTLWDANLFAGNSGLWGGPLGPLPPPLTIIVVKGNGLSKGALSAIVLSAVLVPLGSCFIVGWRWKVYKKLHKQDADLIATLLQREKTALMPLRDLKRATDNFAESATIGEGGFGTVYTGKLQDGTVVAIKRNKREGTEESKHQFLNEVRVLSQVSHRHLVKLLGCCMENKAALLVFEFVPNGTLQEHLRGKKGSGLSWKQRLEIAVQTSDALNYLHSAAQFPIVHRDVKSANILLTEKLKVKVADFGISKLASPEAAEATHFSTVAIQGTMGYIDPEYFTSCQLTVKSDVYSFGVVLLELISAQPVIDFQRPSGNSNLITFATPLIRNQELESLIDPVLKDSSDLQSNLKESVLSVGLLALQCLQDKSKDRPDMKEVWKQLQTAWLSYNQGSADFLGCSFSIDANGESHSRSTDSIVLMRNFVDTTSFSE